MLTLILAMVLVFSPGCASDGSFDIDEIGPTLTDAGEAVVDGADAVDESLGGSPLVDAAAGDEIRKGTATARLIGELLLLAGVFFYRKRAKEGEEVIDEIDANPDSKPAAEQVRSRKARKAVKRIVE